MSEEFIFEMDPDVVPAGEPIRVPPGRYVLELREGAEVLISQNGHPYLRTAWALVEPVDDNIELPEGALGQYFWLNTTLQAGTQRFARALWEAVGLPWGGRMSRQEIEQAFNERAGVRAVGIIRDEEYEGEIRSRLQRVAPLEE